MISAACSFLNELEMVKNKDQDLPVPYVMERISRILQKKLKNRAPKQQLNMEDTLWPAISIDPDYLATPPVPIDQVEFQNAVRTVETMTGPLFVDIQYLNSDQGFVIKEFALRSHGSPVAWVMIESPFDAIPLDDNDYSIDRLHGITWNTGCISVDTLKTIVSNLFSERRVVVKGREKVKILMERLGLEQSQMQSVEDFPTLKMLRESYPTLGCLYHRKRNLEFGCSVKNTYALMCHYVMTKQP